jgi:putative peptide zinc metalloprotease protein
VFEPYGLKVLGQMNALVSLWGLVAMPVQKVYKFFKVPGRMSKVKKLRMYVTLLLLSGFVGGVLLIPFPSSVLCDFELQPRGATSVYVEVEGTLEEILVEPGQHVEAGQVLARLENIDLEIEISQLRGQRNATRAQLASLRVLEFENDQAGLQLDLAQERFDSLSQQLEQKLNDAKRLELVAPTAGTIIPPPDRRESTSDERLVLASWSGSPLKKKNLGATLIPDGSQNLFCKIGDPDRWDAVFVVGQRDLDLVTEGQEVRLMFEQSSYYVYISTVQYLATRELDALSPQLASTSGGPVPAQTNPDGTVQPLTTSYQGVVQLDDSLKIFRNGLIGKARIKTKKRTLANRLYRYLSRTFSFDL